MGIRIAFTAVIIFIFCLMMAALAKKDPIQPKLLKFFGFFMLIGMFAFPCGLIVSIWENWIP